MDGGDLVHLVACPDLVVVHEAVLLAADHVDFVACLPEGVSEVFAVSGDESV